MLFFLRYDISAVSLEIDDEQNEINSSSVADIETERLFFVCHNSPIIIVGPKIESF